MLVSYVIVTYRREKALLKCLKSIFQQEYRPIEIVVVDNEGNAHIDLSTEFTNSPIDLRIIHANENLGAAGGRNLGMKEANGNVYVLLDDDAWLIDPLSTGKVVETFQTNPQTGVIAFRSLDVDEQPILEQFPHPNKRLITCSYPFEVPYFYAMGHAFRAQVIEVTRGYSEYLFYLMEEYELSLRIIEQGYTILYDPEICVIHQREGNVRHAEETEWLYRSTLNKARSAFMKLPMPYPWTITLIWAGRLLVDSKFNLIWLFRLFKTLYSERRILRDLRQPISRETVNHIRSIGGRLLY